MTGLEAQDFTIKLHLRVVDDEGLEPPTSSV